MTVIGLLVILFLIFSSRDEKTILQINNLLIYIYLIILAPSFWRSQSLIFVGRTFADKEMTMGVNHLAISIVILCLAYQIAPISFRYRSQFLDSKPFIIPKYYFSIVLLIITSSLATLFVLGYNSSLSKFLYQMADLGIPMTTLLALSKNYKKAIAMGLMYTFFALYTGFRYKLYFLALPLIAYFILVAGFSSFRKVKLSSLLQSRFIVLSIVFLPAALFTLSVMTFTRIKASDSSIFENIVSIISSLSSPLFYDQIGYGFFAESNILFAMTSIMSDYQVDLVNLSNLSDSILSHLTVLLPSAMRFGHDYLKLNYLVLQIIGTGEALNSGTAYPLIGYINLIFSPYISFIIYGAYVALVTVGIIRLLKLALNYSRYYLQLKMSKLDLTKEYFLVLAVATTGTLGSLAYLIIFRGFSPEMLKTILVIVAGYFILNYPVTRRIKLRA